MSSLFYVGDLDSELSAAYSEVSNFSLSVENCAKKNSSDIQISCLNQVKREFTKLLSISLIIFLQTIKRNFPTFADDIFTHLDAALEILRTSTAGFYDMLVYFYNTAFSYLKTFLKNVNNYSIEYHCN